METTKTKVDLKAIIAKANKKTAQVNKSAVKVESKQDNYRILPGFKKYEYNGLVLRNATTKRIMSLKASNKKYQLISDAGKNIDLSTEQVKALIVPIKEVKEKVAKVTKQKTDKVKKVTIQSQVIGLFKAGMDSASVFENLKALGVKTNINSVRWYISQYKNKKD